MTTNNSLNWSAVNDRQHRNRRAESTATPIDCANPANWGNEQRLTTASFNILDASVARGHFLGDYMGLAASGPNTVYPVFGIATGPNVTTDFTRAIS